MKRVVLACIAATCLAASVQAFADGSDTIIETQSNPNGPAGKNIEIKNVDLHRFDFFPEEGGATITSYSLVIYLWVNRDLGEQTNQIAVIDTNEILLKGLDFTGASKVGFDQTTGDFVYEVRMPVDNQNASHTSAFYAALTLGGVTHYSNEGSPNNYFVFTSVQK